MGLRACREANSYLMTEYFCLPFLLDHKGRKNQEPFKGSCFAPQGWLTLPEKLTLAEALATRAYSNVQFPTCYYCKWFV